MIRPKIRFQLYVAADASNSEQAMVNLTRLCKAYFPEGYEIEIIDVFREPARALKAGVIMTPLLIKLAPAPVRRIIGTLSQVQPVLTALGLKAP